MDNNPPDALVGKRLFPYHTAVYAAPEYLAEHDIANHPERGRWVGWRSDEGRFPEWAKATDFAAAPQGGEFTNLALQAAAAQAGVGLTMLPCFVADQLPGLVRASDRKPEPARDVWILTHADLRRTARIQAVMRFAEEVLREKKNQFAGITA
jgi:DNA-binding transcriptional LysR family regulator